MMNNNSDLIATVGAAPASLQAVSVEEMRADVVRFPRLKTLELGSAVEQLAEIVGTAFMLRGQRATSGDVMFIATNLYTELMADETGCGTDCISMAEIRYAVKKSVLGQGRELYGISVASLYPVIIDYCKGEGHQAEENIRERVRQQKITEFKKSAVGELIEKSAERLVKQSNIFNQ